jgi:hypothetical protein
MKKQKAYCGQCLHYSRKVGSDDRCAKAVTMTVRNTATYMHPNIVRKQYNWEKNQDNKCQDYIKRVSDATND